MKMNHPNRKGGRRGFTLLELLFVLSIVSILAAIAVPNFLEAQVRGKRTEMEQAMAILADALDAYELDQGELPPNVAGNPTAQYALYENSPALARLTTPAAYIGSLPIDVFYPRRSFSPVGGDIGAERRPEWPGRGGQTFGYWRFDSDSVRKGLTPRAVLVCMGPDSEVTHRATADSLHISLYDSSNGSTSRGDLFVVLPPHFQVSEWSMARPTDAESDADAGTVAPPDPAPEFYGGQSAPQGESGAEED